MSFVLLSKSLLSDRISETSEACKVGVNLRGSRGDIVSSKAGLIESVLRRLTLRSSGRGGGVLEGDISFPACDRGDLELVGVR